jgi:hypothetical protein
MSDATNIIGRLTVNGKAILEVDADPSAAPGVPAPIGSMAAFDSGTVGRLYVKAGAADDAWTQLDKKEGDDWNLDGNDLTGADALNPNEFLGSTNDFDVAFQRNSTEIMRLINEGLLVGLATAIPSFAAKMQIGSTANGDMILAQSGPNNGSGARVIRVSRQYKVQTTDDSDTALATLLVPDESRIQGRAFIGGRQHGGTGGSVGDGADYVRSFSVKRDGGAAILNGRTSDFTEEDVSSFRARPVVSGNNAVIEVRGAADRNMAWSCHLEYMVYTD